MNLTQNELIEICSEVTTMLGDILTRHVELNEGLIDQAATDIAQDKIDRLRQQTDDAKARLKKIKDGQKRRRELEKIRKDHEREGEKQTEGKSSQGTISLRNGKGVLIGWLQSESNGKVTVFDAKGRIVARELSGITIDRSGRFRGRGRQGLVVLGRSLVA